MNIPCSILISFETFSFATLSSLLFRRVSYFFKSICIKTIHIINTVKINENLTSTKLVYILTYKYSLTSVVWQVHHHHYHHHHHHHHHQ